MKDVLLLFLFCCAIFFSHLASAGDGWAHCYDFKKNRIYFQTQKDLKRNDGRCAGKLFYQGFKNYMLIEDIKDSKGFPIGEAGTARSIVLNDGRNVLVTQWNNMTKNNTLVVLEPDLKNSRVKTLCVVKNFSKSFKTKEDKKFKVQVRQPVTELSSKFHKVWKTCDK